MKKVEIFILSIAAILSFSGCNQKDVIQDTSSLSTQSSVSTENQNKEIITLRHRINELEAVEAELQRRVGSLENYFDRRTPESVARLWGEAVIRRSGSLQYALFSEELKEETHDGFVSMDWKTGVSSPHASEFTIGKPIRSKDGQAVIKVILRYVASGGDPVDETSTLSLKQTQKEINDDWYIISIKEGS